MSKEPETGEDGIEQALDGRQAGCSRGFCLGYFRRASGRRPFVPPPDCTPQISPMANAGAIRRGFVAPAQLERADPLGLVFRAADWDGMEIG